MVDRAGETGVNRRGPCLRVVASRRTGTLFRRPFRAVMPDGAHEAPVIVYRCGSGATSGSEADVTAGARVADQTVRIGSVSARRALLVHCFGFGGVGRYY